MRNDRLLRLADFLETVPREKFDIALWQASKATKPESARPGECGFSGCAVGWAVHERMVRGFRFGRGRREDPTEIYLQYRKGAKKIEGWDAVGRAFDIDLAQAKHLFSATHYPYVFSTGALDVAKRIRAFVASNGQVP